VKQWGTEGFIQWGTKSFVLPFFRIDLYVGGINLNCMRSPEDKDTGARESIAKSSHRCYSSWLVLFSGEYANVVPVTYCRMSLD